MARGRLEIRLQTPVKVLALFSINGEARDGCHRKDNAVRLALSRSCDNCVLVDCDYTVEGVLLDWRYFAFICIQALISVYIFGGLYMFFKLLIYS